MATGDQWKYSSDESKQTKYVCCSLCSADESRTVARHYCVDCEMYFCARCVRLHSKMPSSKSHLVNNVESADSVGVVDETKEPGDVSVETQTCTIHQDKTLDTFCKDHDDLCCGTCAVVKHRSCSTVSLDEAARDFKNNPEVNKSKESLTEVLTRLTQEKAKRTENIDCIGQQKLKLIEAVDAYEESTIKKVKALANTTRTAIRTKYEVHKAVLDIDVQALDAAMVTSATYVDKLEQTRNETELFNSVRTSKAVIRDGEGLLQAMKEQNRRELVFHFDKTLENTVGGMEAFGRLEDDCHVKEYQPTLQKNVNVKQRNELTTHVYDMFFMESGDWLLADFQNKKLKRFNSDLQLKDSILLADRPIAVCQIDNHEVAVRLDSSKRVQCVSVGQTMQLTSSFQLVELGFELHMIQIQRK